MKNLVAKLKGLNYKEFALQYGERIGLGVVAVLVLGCLALTNWPWSAYAKTPEQLAEDSDKSKQMVVSSVWPETAKNELQVVDYVQAAQQRAKPLDVALFDYKTQMSFKLYPREEPIEEPKLDSVKELIATAGTFVMATAQQPIGDPLNPMGDPLIAGNTAATPARPAGEGDDELIARRPATGAATGAIGAPVPGAPTEGHAETKKKSSTTAKKKTSGSSALDGGAMPGGEGYSADMGGSYGTVATGRGVRFVAVRGVFPYRDQLEKMRRALRYDSLEQAAMATEFLNFKVKRQKAIGGPDPWAGPWEELDTKVALDLLNEAQDLDTDVVTTDVTNQTFTMPLPLRVGFAWGPKMMSHPKLEEYIMTEQKAEQERALNTFAATEFDALGNQITTKSKPAGFASAQRNMAQMRQVVASAMMSASGDAGSQLRQKFSSVMPGGEGSMPPPGGNSAMMGGQFVGLSVGITPQWLLFRYLDVAVEPGECYRYQVQLEIRNPSFGLSVNQVKDPSVVEGETRLTAWSDPSPPVLVEKDADSFLARVTRVARGALRVPKFPPEAEINMYQWDPETGTRVGTLMSDTKNTQNRIATVLKVNSGQYLGGKAKALRLNVIKNTLADEDVNFASKDLLIDTLGAPPMDLALHKDLNINSKAWADLAERGRLDQILVANQYGELVAVDSVSHSGEKQVAERRLQNEQKDFESLIGAEAAAANASGLDAFAGEGSSDGGKAAKKKKTAPNPLRVRNSGG